MAVHDGFDHLGSAGRFAAHVFGRPRLVVTASLAAAIALAWSLLLTAAIRAAAVGGPAAGPGSDLLALLPEMSAPDWLGRFLDLCLAPAGDSLLGLASLTAMWFLMAVATMLPSAAPMIRTYSEIDDTAAAKGEPAPHPFVLVAGYIAVWLAASVGFAILAMLIAAAGSNGNALHPVSGLAGAAALGFAGIYQFSSLKQACLRKCRNPFAILFSRWSAEPARIFRLGLEQGVWCLGCCWALMLLMFAVGVMNIFWMALIGVFALVEKQASGPRASRIAGAILLVWAAALLVVSIQG
jgi:predicted metal-binding membrane protein